ncbi:GDSL-type esterase/lipase family protein [Sphingomonas hankookensis]|uniref:GDSL-type esterase/lipase family protein n=1 Tax=Sphingomonas hankookensis TaxID=563996 RepID=UPI003D301AA3
MAYRSGGIGVGIGTLGRLAVLPDRRLPHVVTALGDSRVAALYLDPARMNRGTRSPLHWANSLLGQRMTIGDTFGVSGDRTDQMLARLPAAIATGAGLLYVQGGINNIGAVASGNPAYTYAHAVTGEVVTIDSVAAVAMRDLRQIADTARRAGMTVVIENEIGGSSLSTAEKIGALNNLRAAIADYGAQTPGVHVHDAYAVVMQPGAATPTFRTGYAYDGIHATGRGAYWHGKSLATLLDRLVPPRSVLSRGAIDTPANGRRQLLANHLFTATTGGTAGNGVTGDVPSGWTAAVSTNAGSAVLSSVANADGVGNGVRAAIDFTAAGSFRLEQALGGTPGGQYHANLRPGDEVEGFALVEITGTPAILAAVQMEASAASAGSGGTGVTSLDMTGPAAATDLGINDSALLTLRTRPIILPVPSGAFPYLFTNVRIIALAAGSATIIVRQIGVRRRSG